MESEKLIEKWKGKDTQVEDCRQGYYEFEGKSDSLNTFTHLDRIVGWFCEAGTTKQQFAAIKVVDKDGNLI